MERYNITFDSVINYINSVYTKYFLNDSNLQKIIPGNLSDELRNLIVKFSNIQDKTYYNDGFPDKTEFELGNGNTDDLFQIYFMLKYGDTEDPYVLMHDAWTLSRIIVFDRIGTYYPYDESGKNLQDFPIILTEDNFDNYYNKNNKEFITVKYTENRILVIQCRRLRQFIDFRNLSLEEKEKNKVPLNTYNNLIYNNVNNFTIAQQLLQIS